MTDFPIYITAWTALILGALLIYLTLQVVLERRTKHIILGDNDDKITAKRIRGHGNATEQIPIALILLGFVESLQGSTYAVIIAVTLVTGRLMHAFYFTRNGTNWRFRFYGMLLTVIAQVMALLALMRALIF